jgi:hypothetical protein
MFLSAFTDSTPSVITVPPTNAPAFTNVTIDQSPIVAGPTPSPPKLTNTPAEPQLSPTKWVHQPLVARRVDVIDSVARHSTLPSELQPQSPTVELNQQDDQMDRSSSPNVEVRPLTAIRRAAIRQRANRNTETSDVPAQTEPIQPGYSIEALRKTAAELIAEAQLKLDIRAYMSAEEKAKKALELIAQSIDTREQSAIATRDLIISLTAIREAEDFVGKYGLVDGETITRMVRSHSTEILKPYDTSKLNGLAAADVYLDWSRRCITPLAVADPLAAEAIRILAQSHRLRDEGTPFGIATSVHLIRAAAEGAPDNQQVRSDYETTLHVAGLTDRTAIMQAKNSVPRGDAGTTVSIMATGSASDQSRSIAPAGAFVRESKRDVKVIEVSPEQFAAISPAAAGPPGTPHVQSMPVSQQNTPQSIPQSNQRSGTYRPEHVNESVPRQAAVSPDNSVKGRLSRAFDPITRHLR